MLALNLYAFRPLELVIIASLHLVYPPSFGYVALLMLKRALPTRTLLLSFSSFAPKHSSIRKSSGAA